MGVCPRKSVPQVHKPELVPDASPSNFENIPQKHGGQGAEAWHPEQETQCSGVELCY